MIPTGRQLTLLQVALFTGSKSRSILPPFAAHAIGRSLADLLLDQLPQAIWHGISLIQLFALVAGSFSRNPHTAEYALGGVWKVNRRLSDC